MIDAYTIGIQLTLENGVSDGLALVQRDLLDTSKAVEGLTADLAGVRRAADGLGASVAGEMARIAQDAQRVTALRPTPLSTASITSQSSADDVSDIQPPAQIITPKLPPILREARLEPLAPALPIVAENVRNVPVTAGVSQTTQVLAPATPSIPISSTMPARSTVQPLAPAPPVRHLSAAAGDNAPRNDSAGALAAPYQGRVAPSQGLDSPRPLSLHTAASMPPSPLPSPLGLPQPAAVARRVPRQEATAPLIAATILPPTPETPAPAGPVSPRPQPTEPVAPSAHPPPASAALPLPLPSAAPRPSPQATGPTSGDVYLDGTRLGRWISDRLARDASRPQAGGVGFDPRMTLAWPGPPIGH